MPHSRLLGRVSPSASAGHGGGPPLSSASTEESKEEARCSDCRPARPFAASGACGSAAAGPGAASDGRHEPSVLPQNDDRGGASSSAEAAEARSR